MAKGRRLEEGWDEPEGASASPDPWEASLVESIRGGGEGARTSWAELLTTYEDRLYAVCFRIVRNPDIARDLTQDAMVKVMQGFGSYDGRARLSTWMTRITMNVCLSYLRKQKLRRHASLDAPGGGGGRFSGGAGRDEGGMWNGLAQGTEPGAEERVEADEARSLILRAMGEVEPEHRAVLVLRDMQGLDYQEIAEALEVPVGTVKSRLFRARQALRGVVEKMGGGEGVRTRETDER